MTSNTLPPFRLGLISMPWSIFNRPSIQLGALKAYLDANAKSVATTVFHPYLQAAAAIGTKTYHYLSKNSWAGEALYSPMLFPEHKKQAEKLFYASCAKEKGLQQLNFDNCGELLEQALEQWLESVDFAEYDLIGFSVCFNQLISSLTAAKRIKKRFPKLPIVIGGSGCVSEIGLSLLQNFPQIDYVISGEGEEALAVLSKSLQAPEKKITLPPGIMTRNTRKPIKGSCGGITNLNRLPAPDYSPYFQEMGQIFQGHPFVPILPIEFSRGCWWNKCTFCNLNLQWHGYRWKNADTMLEEVRRQSARHQCLDFCFTDNALPPKEAETFFKTLSTDNRDFDFFAEVRVITDPDTPQLYRRGGLSTIQVGIESLSTSLLKKMQKGTTAIENIAAMRQSAEAGIQLDGNLITEFPGSSPDEIKETLNNLDFVLPYPALAAASFFLGHGAPVAKDPGSFGILAVTQHAKNRQLFPKAVLQNLNMLIKDYRGDRSLQRTLWKEVNLKVEGWNTFHKDRNSLQSPLSYRDGKDFLLIRQEQLNGPTLQHRLHGLSREIYLFCRNIRSFEEINNTFPNSRETTIRRFFQDLFNKKLIFQENDQFLALAIKGTPFSPFPSF